MLRFLSFRTRFLIAPAIGIVLTIILFASSNSVIRFYSSLFNQISHNNLPQISKISHTAILLSVNHSQLTNLLLQTMQSPDEETVYIKGRSILNTLHSIEQQLNSTFTNNNIIINRQPVTRSLESAFQNYRNSVISAIEFSTVDASLAQRELLNANQALKQLSSLLLEISNFHQVKLKQASDLVEKGRTQDNYIPLLTIVLILLMLLISIYFSKKTTQGLDKVLSSLFQLSEGNLNVQHPHDSDPLIEKLFLAIDEFKQSLIRNKKQQQDLKQLLSQLKDSESRLFSVLELIPTGIIAIEPDTWKITIFNQAAERIFGYSGDEIIGQSINQLIPDKYHHIHNKMMEFFIHSDISYLPTMNSKPVEARKKNGDLIFIDANLSQLSLENETIIIIAVTDVTENKKQQEQIIHQAHYDTLTELPNRFLMLDRLSQLINDARRNQKKTGVIFLDLDDFKKINDTLGHEVGDKLLIQAAERLTSIVRQGDTVSRLGGDEFVILIGGLKDEQVLQHLLESILEQFRTAFTIDERKLILTTSIGIAVYPGDGATPSELLRHSDIAMYHSKNSGRNTWSFFNHSMNRSSLRRFTIEEQLHQALERNEFSINYQPQIDIQSQKIVGAEALLRWDNATVGDISPSEFIPVAERTGLINSLSQFVLENSLEQLKTVQNIINTEFRMAVNLSPQQFRDPHLVQNINQLLIHHNLSGHCLELEITEGVLLQGHRYVQEALRGLSALGISLAMDDFGTGYSSLSYLRTYPFNILKIDRSFISGLTSNEKDRRLINVIVAMAHALNLRVIAEGVETKEQLDFLKSTRCNLFQGFLYSRALTDKQLLRVLEKQSLQK